MGHSEINKIAFVGDYLPRKCGIATFTHDMYTSIAANTPSAECFVVPVNDRPEGYEYPPEARFEIDEQDLDSYLRAADFLNFANTDGALFPTSSGYNPTMTIVALALRVGAAIVNPTSPESVIGG